MFHDTTEALAETGKNYLQCLEAAGYSVDALPEDRAGECVVNATGELFQGSIDQLVDCLQKGSIIFHKGTIGGAWPQIAKTRCWRKKIRTEV